jgi:hypothetical protein
MLELQALPLVSRFDSGADCQPVVVPDICAPCRQLDEYLPKLVVSHKAQAYKELATAFLQLDDSLMEQVCATPCLTWETEDCDCLLAYGAHIGLPPRYTRVLEDYCTTPFDVMDLPFCETHKVKMFCDPFCPAPCEVVELDCTNEVDKAFYQKMLKYRTLWLRRPATRQNITQALKEWFDGFGYVLGSLGGVIYWTLGRDATSEEMAFMPTLQTLLPVSEFATLQYVEVLND